MDIQKWIMDSQKWIKDIKKSGINSKTAPQSRNNAYALGRGAQDYSRSELEDAH